MKILEINKFYYLRGGSEAHFFAVIDLLREKGHEVIPFAMQDEKNIKSKYDKYFTNNIDVNKFSLNSVKIFYNYNAVRNLKKLIKKEKPDIAHLHNIAHHLTPAIIKVIKKNNIPVIQTLHDYKLVCPAYTAYRAGKTCYECKGGKYYNCVKYKCHKNSRFKSLIVALESYINNQIFRYYNMVDFFIAPSNFMKNVCVNFGIEEKRIKVINNFLNFDNFLNQEKGELETQDYIFYFGRISKEKGLDVLIDVMKKYNGKLKLKIAGSGEYEEILKQKVEKYNLQNKIKFLGFQPKDKLIKLIKTAQAVVLPSACNENMSYSMLEAMFLGKVVIASRVGGSPELIQDKLNGFLFASGNRNLLLEIISNLDNFDLEKIGERAKYSAQKMNKSNYYIEFKKILNKLK